MHRFLHVLVPTRGSAFAALSAVAVTALCACGSSSTTVDTAAVGRSIEQTIRAEHGLRTTVTCPTHVVRKAGTTFTCSAALDVGAYPVQVTVADSSGRVVYQNGAPLIALDIAKVAAAIRKSILQRTGASATVICPTEVLQQSGLGFTCTATFGGRTRSFAVIQGAGGRVRYSEAA